MQTPDDDAWLAGALTRYASSRDPELRDEILARTEWLATRGARRFADRGEPFDDLLQVARIGLLKALERFDPAHGVHFAAFATPTIVGELRRYFRDHTWSVHVPRRAKDLRPAVMTASEELFHELGRSPRIDELAARVRQPPDVVIEALEAGNAYRARELEPSGTTLADPATPEADHVIDREVVRGLLDRLQPRERRILYLRFFDELSQAQIAEVIGTSQVHVGRLLNASLASLRTHLAEDR